MIKRLFYLFLPISFLLNIPSCTYNEQYITTNNNVKIFAFNTPNTKLTAINILFKNLNTSNYTKIYNELLLPLVYQHGLIISSSTAVANLNIQIKILKPSSEFFKDLTACFKKIKHLEPNVNNQDLIASISGDLGNATSLNMLKNVLEALPNKKKKELNVKVIEPKTLYFIKDAETQKSASYSICLNNSKLNIILAGLLLSEDTVNGNNNIRQLKNNVFCNTFFSYETKNLEAEVNARVQNLKQRFTEENYNYNFNFDFSMGGLAMYFIATIENQEGKSLLEPVSLYNSSKHDLVKNLKATLGSSLEQHITVFLNAKKSINIEGLKVIQE